MNAEIIKVTPTEQYFSLNWRVNTRCNYDCMYCSPEWHDNHSGQHSLETLQQAWIRLFDATKHHDLPYKISFGGGELTSNKDFLPFVMWLRENYNDKLFKLLFTTNGSATYKYYSRMFKYMDNISFSLHSEHVHEKKFFDMIIKLKKTIDPSRFIEVIIMDEYWNQDRIPLYTQLLDRHLISYTVNQIDYSHQTRTIPIMKGKQDLNV
jgi:MoaA/NifB/PqqE/SkfB family radical SAM enzyme